MQFNSDNNAMILNNIASIYANQKNYDSALFYLKTGYASYPKDLMILQNIAAVSYLNKSYEQAIAFAMKALEINNQLKKSYGVLADTYTALGNLKEATRYRTLYNQTK
jgi:tetratricopeptide (TPR) repeat protein